MQILNINNSEINVLETRYILKKILGKYIIDKQINLTDKQYKVFQSILKRRIKGEPLAKIIQEKSFWKSDFITNHHTLDPRPDSESMIEIILNQLDVKKAYKILDLGTGTGCLILSLLQEFPLAKGVAIDISHNALKIAQKNSKNLNLEKRCLFIQNNWLQNITEKFDVIISNPPYIALGDNRISPEALFDPYIALFAGSDGLDAYRAIFKDINKIMNISSVAFFEIGKNQEKPVIKIANQNQLKFQKSFKDLRGITRILSFKRSFF